MDQGVKVTPSNRRHYDASSRRDQARRTRQAILETARTMFLAQGYTEVSVPAVAAAVGVSTQSVYKAFGSKAKLAKTVFDVAMAGDDEKLTMLERQALSGVRKEPDPYEKLRKYADFVAGTAPRHVPIQLLLRDAALTDPDAAAVWADLCDERLTGMEIFARALTPHLRDDVSADQARDLLWAQNSPELWQLLVVQRGWTPLRYAGQLADTLIASLLP